jgi:hypothetical protein
MPLCHASQLALPMAVAMPTRHAAEARRLSSRLGDDQGMASRKQSPSRQAALERRSAPSAGTVGPTPNERQCATLLGSSCAWGEASMTSDVE